MLAAIGYVIFRGKESYRTYLAWLCLDDLATLGPGGVVYGSKIIRVCFWSFLINFADYTVFAVS